MRCDLIRTELLVIRYKRGHPEALGELVSLWQNPLYYYIRRLIPDETEAMDVLQDAWLKVIRKFKQLRDPAAFPAWLFRIARNIAYDHLRRVRPSEISDDEEPVSEASFEEGDVLLDSFSAEDVHNALAGLSITHRECLILRFIEGLSLSEISDVTDAPIGTVKSRLHHARKSLRRILEEEVRANG